MSIYGHISSVENLLHSITIIKEQEVSRRTQGRNKCKHTRGCDVTRDNLGKNLVVIDQEVSSVLLSC